MDKLWTIGSLLQWTQDYFARHGIDTPRLDAEILLAHVLKKDRIYLYAHYDQPMNHDELAQYRGMVKKRAGRLSVAHILGTKPFMGLDFRVTEDVLVPRPETEMLVETVLALDKEKTRLAVADIGTGSGAIILSILHYAPQAVGTGIDISPQALGIARENGEKLGLNERVTWVESDIFSAVPRQQFDWIVSNPPYLTQMDMEHLEPEVRHDPETALFGGADGLDVYRRIAAQSPGYLAPGGCCALEVGSGQAAAVTDIFCSAGAYCHIKTVKDYGGIERVVLFRRKEQI